MASSNVLPLIHSVANELDAIAEPQPNVLNFVSISDNFSDSKKNIIDNIERLNWPGGFYRKDIGYKVIK